MQLPLQPEPFTEPFPPAFLGPVEKQHFFYKFKFTYSELLGNAWLLEVVPSEWHWLCFELARTIFLNLTFFWLLTNFDRSFVICGHLLDLVRFEQNLENRNTFFLIACEGGDVAISVCVKIEIQTSKAKVCAPLFGGKIAWLRTSEEPLEAFRLEELTCLWISVLELE